MGHEMVRMEQFQRRYQTSTIGIHSAVAALRELEASSGELRKDKFPRTFKVTTPLVPYMQEPEQKGKEINYTCDQWGVGKVVEDVMTGPRKEVLRADAQILVAGRSLGASGLAPAESGLGDAPIRPSTAGLQKQAIPATKQEALSIECIGRQLSGQCGKPHYNRLEWKPSPKARCDQSYARSPRTP
jgi:hypothetical protein